MWHSRIECVGGVTREGASAHLPRARPPGQLLAVCP